MSSRPENAAARVQRQALEDTPRIGGRGVLTLAHGSQRFINMAKLLGESLRWHAPHLRRAVVTDSHRDLADVYDLCIPVDLSFGKGLLQKLHLDLYTPFDETLFVDSDCLVVGPIDPLWPLFSAVPVGVVGGPIRDEYWFGDVAVIRERLGVVEPVPHFNGGLIYLDSSPEARAVFGTARDLMSRYGELGFAPLRGGRPNDEPVLAFALALHGIGGVDDGGHSMRTPIGIRGPLRLDVLRGGSRFNKQGVVVEPTIVHFCGWRARGFHYRRERLKLRLANSTMLPPGFISRTVNAIANPPYTAVAALCRPPLRVAERHRGHRK
jgi:hypothetical protein